MTPHPPEEPGALARIRAGCSALGPSERRVAMILVERPADVVEWSAAEVAAAADTSPATVVRACQSLGFSGFQHLRLELARTARPSRPRGASAPSSPLESIVEESLAAVGGVRFALDETALGAAAALLHDAGRILLAGNGFSGPPLQDFAMRLATSGRGAEAPVDPLAQQFTASSLLEGDVCLALSYSGANQQTLRACRAAAAAGARIVLVTSFARSPLSRISDVVLLTGAREGEGAIDSRSARLAQSVVLHALHSALTRCEGSGSASAMQGIVADALVAEE